MRISTLGYGLRIIWLLLSLSGCGAVRNLVTSDADELKERAQARWEALIHKDWDTAYQYELPAYRQTHDVNQFRAKFGVKLQWKFAEVKSSTILQEDKTADVKLKLAYKLVLSDGEPIENESEINERWLKQEGDWWITN